MTPPVLAKPFIAHKREGGVHTREELTAFLDAAVRGELPDYQISAWLMAVYFRGMSAAETADLTRTMIETGISLPLVSAGPLPVDKHSTGGVGDKLSFLVAPLVAAAGGIVPMISGRSLGHTGGTLDKLESIPGFRTNLEPEEFLENLRANGVCICGQSERMVPADRLLYALRDATSTVESIPLITASILSKKVAEGAGALVLDVKFGSGAFMVELAEARRLAASLVETAALLGQRVRAYLTDMNWVLGRTAGNALEVAESIEVLRGGPAGAAPDLRELTFALGGGMLELAGVCADAASARDALGAVWADGRGLERFRRMIELQGGDAGIVDDPTRLPLARELLVVESHRAGRVLGLAARPVGEWLTESGGGRLRKGDRIDPRVGVELLVEPGTTIAVGEPVVRLHLGGSPPDPGELQARARGWIEFGEDGPGPWVAEVVD